MQTEGLPDFFEAVAAGGVGLRHGAVAFGLFDEMGQRWRSSPTLCAGDFRVDGFALGLLWQRLGKVIIAQVKLTFQVVPDAGQADASAHMVNVRGGGRGRLTAKLGEQPSALEPLGWRHAAHRGAVNTKLDINMGYPFSSLWPLLTDIACPTTSLYVTGVVTIACSTSL